MPRGKILPKTPVAFAGEADTYTVVSDLGDTGIVLRDKSGEAFLSPRSCVTATVAYAYSAPKVDKPPTNDTPPEEG